MHRTAFRYLYALVGCLFKVPVHLLKKLMEYRGVEIFINIMWRELSMAISQGLSNKGMGRLLDGIFDGSEWQKLIGLDFNTQADACVQLFREKVGAKGWD